MVPGGLNKEAKTFQEYREYLESIGYPTNLLDVECAWARQQAPGTVAHLLECVKTIAVWREQHE